MPKRGTVTIKRPRDLEDELDELVVSLQAVRRFARDRFARNPDPDAPELRLCTSEGLYKRMKVIALMQDLANTVQEAAELHDRLMHESAMNSGDSCDWVPLWSDEYLHDSDTESLQGEVVSEADDAEDADCVVEDRRRVDSEGEA